MGLTTTPTTSPVLQGTSSHPLNKQRAREIVVSSPLDSWLREACLARIDDDSMPDNPRMIVGMVMVYFDLCKKQAEYRQDIADICAICQASFSLRCELHLKHELMQCSPKCEHYNLGHGPH